MWYIEYYAYQNKSVNQKNGFLAKLFFFGKYEMNCCYRLITFTTLIDGNNQKIILSFFTLPNDNFFTQKKIVYNVAVVVFGKLLSVAKMICAFSKY